MPAERAADLTGMLTGVPVSAGFVDKASSRLDGRLQDAGFDAAMRAALAAEPALGADETPVNVVTPGPDPETGEPDGQHIIRRSRLLAGLGPGSLQSWAADVIEVLRAAHKTIEDARARGDPAAAQDLQDLCRRYDEAVAFGITHNRHRDWHDGTTPA